MLWIQSENTYFTEVCSVFEAGSYLRLIDVVYHSTLGMRGMTMKKIPAGTSTGHPGDRTPVAAYRGTSPMRNAHPLRTTIGS